MKQHTELQRKSLKFILDTYRDSFMPLDQQSLITCLKEIQKEFGYVPLESYPEIIELFKSSSKVITALIHRSPSLIEEGGPHLLLMCTGERCKNKGSLKLISEAEKYLGCRVSEVSKDGLFELKTKNCLNRCAFGKNLNIDTSPYTEMNVDKLHELIDSMRKSENKGSN